MTETINGIPQPVNVGEKYVKATWFATASSGTVSGTVTKPAGAGVDSIFIMDEWGVDSDALVSTMANGKPTWESPVDSGGSTITTTFNTSGEYAFSGTPSPAGDHAIIFIYKCYLKNFNLDESLFESELVPATPGSDHTIASHSDTTATGTELETLTDGSNADSLHAHAHSSTTGQGTDDHHAQLHAATHKDSGADDLLSAPGAIGGTTPAAATFTDMDVIHTATEADDHAVELDVDAAGYGDVKALDINYTTGAIAAGQDEGIILINIDETAATGGDVFAVEVLATDGSAGIYGLKAGALVGPIHQDSGVFVSPTTGTDNTASTDVPAMIDGSTGTTTAIFENDNEYIIIGAAAAFEEMEAILTTTASVSIKPTFWYSTAGTAQFTQFTPVDGTNGFKNTGVIAWDASDLTGHVADDVTGTFDIKIIRTKNSLTTSPILGYIKVAATTEYVWDKSGNVNINSLSLGGQAVDLSMNTHKLTGLKVPASPGDSIRATAKITEALLESATDHLTGIEHAELNAWLDDVVLADGGAITTTQVATFAQLVLTPRAAALSAVQGAIFFDSDDISVYVCTEGA